MDRPLKYLIMTGGSLSGLGKGTTISSIGVILKCHNIRVTAIKIDPYLNVDAGTMSPYEHGEVFVLEDGGEVDLDLGNYERFLGITLTQEHNITSGKIYKEVLDRERRGDYLGKTVQMVPHITDAIQARIERVSTLPVDDSMGVPDVCLVEVGGTVGDVESIIYLEALQRFIYTIGPQNVCLCHLTFVPKLGDEFKTKPAQHSVKELQRYGLRPDFIFCRAVDPLTDSVKQKLSLIVGIPPSHIVSVHTVNNIFHVPMELEKQNVGSQIAKVLGLPDILNYFRLGSRLSLWEKMATRAEDSSLQRVRIGIVGKYTGLQDSYLSVVNSLRYAAHEARLLLQLEWIESSDLQSVEGDPNPQNKPFANHKAAWERLESSQGILCPGGFGDRGIEGKGLASRHCRRTGKPYFGICLGMQTAVIDFCRDVLGYPTANSEEFDSNAVPKACVYMPETPKDIMGGTMRLGNRITSVQPDSMTYKLYDSRKEITERHRHRYEVNPQLVDAMEKQGLKFIGKDSNEHQRMEIAELEDHPFFLCTQFHPEFTSRPQKPNPCFLGFVLATAGQLCNRLKSNGGNLYSGQGYA